MTDLMSRLLGERGWLLTDGATGTNLMGMGLAAGYPPEFWNVEHPDRIRQHYRSFIEAGSDIVLTNTFGGTANRLKLHNAGHRVHEINKAAATLLKEEIARSGRKVVCAGSVGPTGELFQPLGEQTYEQGVAAYEEQIRGLKDGGIDVVWIETMFSEPELRAAREAAARQGLPAAITMTFDTSGRTMMGHSPADWVRLAESLSPPLVAFGGNCGTGAPDLMAGLISIQGMLKPETAFITKANCGVPELKGEHVHYNGTPELMATYALMARAAGARIIGGCCGTTPAHIRAMRAALEASPKGACPTIEEVISQLGPLTGATRTLLDGAAPARRARTRARGDGGAA